MSETTNVVYFSVSSGFTETTLDVPVEDAAIPLQNLLSTEDALFGQVIANDGKVFANVTPDSVKYVNLF